ncbi:MAG: alpha/beta hydrolase, partial [Planctomycetota bacterium]
TEKVPFQNVEFVSADGTRLHGWFADHPDPIGIALVCHGNAGNITSRGDSLMILNRRHQLAVMIFDYRGYGQSDGRPDEQGLYADARAARAWLAKRKQVSEQDIILMGRSLGGAVAVEMAASDGARGLVLASTFTSMPAVANNLLPFFPAKFLMSQQFNSIEKIANYKGPLLQSHGDSDELIPFRQGRQLFEAAKGQKTFVRILNAGHNDPQSEEYRQKLDEFLLGIKTQ